MNNKENPIVVLAEFVHKMFGQSIKTEVLGKTGEDHNPIIEAMVTLPDGSFFKACGKNKRLAKQLACEMALDKLFPEKE